jgi:dephospho-CoA kinase
VKKRSPSPKPPPSNSTAKAASKKPAAPARSGSTRSASAAAPAPARLQPARRAILGLLGGIASGKSTVSSLLAAEGHGVVFDADAVARECLDMTARDGRLAEALGAWAVTSSGAPDRRAIATRVFDDAALLRALERITHPAVLARIEDAVEDHRAGKGAPLLVLDVPLLIETGLDRRCDALWFVDAPDESRYARANERLRLSREEVQKRESAQSPLERKRSRADVVIRNDGTLADLKARVVEALRGL